MAEATYIRFPYAQLQAWGEKVLSKTPMSQEEISTVVRVLLDTNLRGMDTHGINMLASYSERYKSIEHKDITIAEDKGAGCIIDGGNHTGQMTSMFALEKAMEKADKFGIGLALGIGFYEGALVAGTAIYLILTALQRWDDKMHQNAKMMELYIEYAEEYNLSTLIRQLRNLDVEIDGLQTEGESAIEDGARAMILTLRLHRKCNHPLMIKDIKKIDGVLYVDEL